MSVGQVSFWSAVRASIPCDSLVRVLLSEGVTFFRGVADSTLVGLEGALEELSRGDDAMDGDRRVDFARCACEAQAMSEAAAHFLVSGEVCAVYAQNSGLGAMLDGLTSLWDFPCVMLVDWRGVPGLSDAAQHVAMGSCTEALLDAVGVRRFVLGDGWEASLRAAAELARRLCRPVACLVVPTTLVRGPGPAAEAAEGLSDDDAVGMVASRLGGNDVLVTSVGNVSRIAMGHVSRGSRDLAWLPVCGDMGQALPVAAGVARRLPRARVWCVEGDGSAAMGLSSVASVYSRSVPNLRHVVLLNGTYGTFGGRMGTHPEDLSRALCSASHGTVSVAVGGWSLSCLVDALARNDGFGGVVVNTCGHVGPELPRVDFPSAVEAFRSRVGGLS